MSISFEGGEFLVGPRLNITLPPFGYSDAGRVWYFNQSCTLLRKDANPDDMLLVIQYHNTQFPTFHSLRSRSQLLAGWA